MLNKVILSVLCFVTSYSYAAYNAYTVTRVAKEKPHSSKSVQLSPSLSDCLQVSEDGKSVYLKTQGTTGRYAYKCNNADTRIGIEDVELPLELLKHHSKALQEEESKIEHLVINEVYNQAERGD